MQVIEVTGKTVQEATQTAAQKLGAAPDQLVVTVIEEHQGLFGKATVRIRAQAPEKAAPPEPVPATVAAQAPAPSVEPKRQPARERTPRERHPVAKEMATVEPDLAPDTAAIAEIGNGASAQRTEATHAPTEAEATQEDADRLLKLVQNTLQIGDLEVSAKVTGTSGRYVNIELDGHDVAFLVGKHGEVLNALQYVTNIIANQQYGNGIRVTLDGNNYRHRREEALTKLANKIAEQVQQRGEEAVLDALPAFERRIVHKALAEYGGVATYSEGEEPNRRVVIAPAD